MHFIIEKENKMGDYMGAVNERLIEKADEFARKLFPVACDIFDNPEIGEERKRATQ